MANYIEVMGKRVLLVEAISDDLLDEKNKIHKDLSTGEHDEDHIKTKVHDFNRKVDDHNYKINDLNGRIEILKIYTKKCH